MERLRPFVVSIVLCLLPIAEVQSGERYDVIGVDSSDSLNMRQINPGTDRPTQEPIVGTIPPDAVNVSATGVTVRFGDSLWREISYSDQIGWVNSRFLRPASTPFSLTKDDRLECGGNEPFWSLDVSETTAVLRRPKDDGASMTELAVKESRSGINRPGLKFVYLQSADEKVGLSAIVNVNHSCSDGATDFDYPIDVFVMGLFPGQGPVHGCCSFRVSD